MKENKKNVQILTDEELMDLVGGANFANKCKLYPTEPAIPPIMALYAVSPTKPAEPPIMALYAVYPTTK